MDRSAVVRCAVVACVLWLAAFAASAETVTRWRWGNPANPVTGVCAAAYANPGNFGTAQEACSDFAPRNLQCAQAANGGSWALVSAVSTPGGACTVKYQSGPSGGPLSPGQGTVQMEPYQVEVSLCFHLGEKAVTEEQQSAAGNYQCERVEGHTTCLVGPMSADPSAGGSDTGTGCFPISATMFCEARGSRIMSASKDDKWYSWLKDPKYTSLDCIPPAEPPPPPLPPGKCPGEVNGQAVVVACSTTSTPNSSTQTNVVSTPSGTQTTSVTSNTTTTCTGDKCTSETTKTTTTTTDTGTPPPTTTTTTDKKTEERPKSEFCTENPNSKQCDDDNTSFSGNCSSNFQCSGGAAECAIARAVNQANCQLTPGSEVAGVAAQLAAGTFGAPLPVVNRSVGQFDQANPLGGSCPTNHSLVLMGLSISVPLGDMCDELQMLGNLLVALTLLGATMFVIRGVA